LKIAVVGLAQKVNSGGGQDSVTEMFTEWVIPFPEATVTVNVPTLHVLHNEEIVSVDVALPPDGTFTVCGLLNA
jgi:hypothetical protein